MSKENPKAGDVFTHCGNWWVLVEAEDRKMELYVLPLTCGISTIDNSRPFSEIYGFFEDESWQYQFSMKDLLLGVSDEFKL